MFVCVSVGVCAYMPVCILLQLSNARKDDMEETSNESIEYRLVICYDIYRQRKLYSIGFMRQY